jgi:hypothetical protein
MLSVSRESANCEPASVDPSGAHEPPQAVVGNADAVTVCAGSAVASGAQYRIPGPFRRSAGVIAPVAMVPLLQVG